MDAKDTYPGGYEQTLPVLSRSPSAAAWPVADPIPHTDSYEWDSYTVPPHSALAPTETSPVETTAPSPVPQPPASKPSQPAQTTSTECNAPSKVRKPRKPRKAANAPAGKSTLFWVHTDPQSASGATKEETLKRIRSHVMSEHNRKSKLENTKRYKSKSRKHLAFQPPETVAGSFGRARPSETPASTSSSSSPNSRRSSQAVDQVNTKQELVPTSTALDYYNAAESWDESWDEGNFDEVVGYPARPEVPSLWSYVGSGAHDPFNMGHTQLTDRMMRHLQNCRFFFSRFQECLLTLINSPLGSDTRSASFTDAV